MLYIASPVINQILDAYKPMWSLNHAISLMGSLTPLFLLSLRGRITNHTNQKNMDRTSQSWNQVSDLLIRLDQSEKGLLLSSVQTI